MAGRVKVKLEYPRNIVYIKILESWKEIVSDSKMCFSIRNAMNSLKAYPLPVEGIDELKRLSGIGDVIATRLEACWELFAFEEGDNVKSTTKVKASITKERATALINATQKGRNKGRVPNLTKSSSTISSSSTKTTTKRLSSSQIPSTSNTMNDDDEFTEKDDLPKKPKMARHNSDPITISSDSSTKTITVSNQSSTSSTVPREVDDSDDDEDGDATEYVSITPRDAAEVILIMDLAEKNGNAKKSVVDLLEKKDIRVERRRLSVGDYLWIARKLDGSEMCLDWIIERKTWSDLRHSIHSSRYQEQKQRLRAAPFTNKVYLLEGDRTGESSLEQALVTTMVHDNYMIQRTLSCHKSAEFLASLTKRLQQQVKVESMRRVSFESVQKMGKKSSSIEKLADVWTRMLMVVPGMSSDSAKLLAERFPSFSSLLLLCRSSSNPAGSLLSQVPSLGRALIANVVLFFQLADKNQ